MDKFKEKFYKEFVSKEDLDGGLGITYYLREDIQPNEVYDFFLQELSRNNIAHKKKINKLKKDLVGKIGEYKYTNTDVSEDEFSGDRVKDMLEEVCDDIISIIKSE